MQVTQLSVNAIKDNLITNCRKNLDIEDLKESILAVGLQTPIGVTAVEGGYAVVYGFRRLQAMRELGRDLIDARILEESSTSSLYLLNLQENVTRKNLSPIEEAEAIQRLIDLGESPDSFAPALGWSKTLITQRLSLLDYSGLIQEALHEDTVSVRQAKLIDSAEEAHQEILLDLAKDGATLATIKAEMDLLENLTKEDDDAEMPIFVDDEEEPKLSLDDSSTDTSAEDKKAIAEANENIIKSSLLDCGAKVVKDQHAYFAYQVALNCVDFKKLSAEQLDALVSVVNILAGDNGLDAWGEASKR